MSFPENLGLAGVGDGKVVLPSPPIEPEWNASFRGYEDGTFRWGLVTGLEPDPTLGYQFVEAASYRLEITPDLGWANEESMFQPYAHEDADSGNARLLILTGLVVGDELEAQDDESAIYEASLATMKRILAPGFDRYLWRVRAVSAAGSMGHSSAIQSFRGRVIVASMAWSINPIDSPARSATIVITGKREPSVTSIEVNGDAGFVSFPTADTWRIDYPLLPGRNVLFFRAFDSQGNGSEYRDAEVDFVAKDLSVRSVFNTFDDFAYRLGLERLPGERNPDLRRRTQDVLAHRAGPHYEGLMNAVGREVDLTYHDQALLLRAAVNPGTQRRWTQVVAWMTPRHFCVRRPDFRITHEYQDIEGRTWQARPAEVADSPDFLIEVEPGVPVPLGDYRVERDEDGPFIQFLKPEYAGRYCYLTYGYTVRVSIVGLTVEELAEALNALEMNGKPILEVDVDTTLSEDARAEGLQYFPPVVLSNPPYVTAGKVVVDDMPVRWMEAELYAFADEEFRWRFKNEHGSQLGTPYSAWAYRLKKQLKTTWGYLVADEAVWAGPWTGNGGCALDLIYSPFRGRWMSTRGDSLYALPHYVAAAKGFVDPIDGSLLIYDGIPWDWFWSGIGFGRDLMVIVDEDAATLENDVEEQTEVLQTDQGDPETENLGIGVDGVDTSSEVS